MQNSSSKIEKSLSALASARKRKVFPLIMGSELEIDNSTVADVLDELRKKFTLGSESLDVFIHSTGGNIHAAYNLGLLFRRYATKDLTFIVPRWAKSAATLLVCSGNRVLMGPVSELGPVDPQITQYNSLEKRLEQFSPLHIDATLELIRKEFKNGHEQLAKGLLERLQFPLTLGGFYKSLEIGKSYLTKLLSARMFSRQKDAEETAKRVASELVEGYPDHGFCVEIDEARNIGISVAELSKSQFDLCWGIYQLVREKERVLHEERSRKMQELLKNLPAGDEDILPESLRENGDEL